MPRFIELEDASVTYGLLDALSEYLNGAGALACLTDTARLLAEAANAPPPGASRWFLWFALFIFVLRFVITAVHKRMIFHAHSHSKRY